MFSHPTIISGLHHRFRFGLQVLVVDGIPNPVLDRIGDIGMPRNVLPAVFLAICVAVLAVRGEEPSTPKADEKKVLRLTEKEPATPIETLAPTKLDQHFESTALLPKAAKQQVWVHFDYLLWRINAGPAPVPLLTVNQDSSTTAALNEPGTRVLFGGQSGKDFDFGFQNGVRLNLGYWLDTEGQLAIDVSGFLFEGDVSTFKAYTPGNGGPVLGIPVNAVTPFGTDPAGETSLSNGDIPSMVRIRSSTDAWSKEANLMFVPDPAEEALLGFLVGGRYMNLHERFELTDTFSDGMNNSFLTVRDAISTTNHFAGLNLGTRMQWNRGRWNMSVNGKVGLGVVSQRVTIRGETVVNASAFGLGNFVFPGGVFAQASNTGTFSRERFGILPEANFKLAYTITPHLHVSVGYDALFLNSVLRPGNQIDRNVNVNQSILFGNGSVGNPARPSVSMNDSSLWMHGISFGLGLTY